MTNTAPETTADKTPVEFDLQKQLASHVAYAAKPEAIGEAAFEALSNIQVLLMQGGYNLATDSGYIAAGFKGRQHFLEQQSRHALAEAKKHYDIARAKDGEVYTLETIDDHPVNDFKAAYQWLKLAGVPLFSEKPYRVLDTARAEFFNELQAAHVDAVYRKIRIAKHLATGAIDDESGLALVNDVIKDHLPALGVWGIDPYIEGIISTDAKTVDDLHRHFTMKKFREVVADARRQLFKNGPVYMDLILEAEGIRQQCGPFEQSPQTYEGLGLNPDTFAAEVDRCAKGTLVRIINELSVGEVSGDQFADAQARLRELRDLFEDVDAPEGTEPALANEDYWMHDILQQFTYRSFTNMMDHLHVTAAAHIINNAFSDVNLPEMEMYEALIEAEAHLNDARFPIEDPEALEGINVDGKGFGAALNYVGPTAALDRWNALHIGRADTETRIGLLTELYRNQTRLADTDAANHMPFSANALIETERAVILARVGELLADYTVCLDSGGAHKILDKAYEYLEDLEMDLLSPEVRKPLGLKQAFAIHIDNQYTLVSLLDHWHEVANEDAKLQDRFEALGKFRAMWDESGGDDLEAAFLAHAEMEAMPDIDALARSFAKPLYAQTMEMLADFRDDPMEAASMLETASACVVALHPKALESELHFNRYVGGSLSKFKAEIERAKRIAENAVKPLAIVFKHADGAAAMLADAMKPEYRGAEAYNRIETLARHLRDVGRTILDADILGPNNLKPHDLQAFLDAQALRAAQEYADAARSKKGIPVTLSTLENHPYNDFRQAINWVARISNKGILADCHWQAMGFASRWDFFDQIRESLVDLATQMESRVVTFDGLSKGPFAMFGVLREIRMAYGLLGLEDDRDIPDSDKQGKLTASGGNIDTAQRAIIKMGYTACRQIMNEKKPDSAKYKMMRSVLSFASQMKTIKWGDPQKMAYVNESFEYLIQARITHALQAYKKRPGTPARAVNLAITVRDMAQSHNALGKPWLNAAFQSIGFASLSTFSDYACVQRIRQLHTRITKAWNDRDPSEMMDPFAFLNAFRDLDRIDNLAGKNGLINAQRKNEIIANLDLEPEAGWFRSTKKMAAVLALPVLARQVADPTLRDSVRFDLINECHELAELINPNSIKNVAVDWRRMERQRTRTIRRLGASHMVTALMRDDFETVSQALLSADMTLSMANMTLKEPAFLRQLELKPDEVARLSETMLLMPAYLQIERIENAEPNAIPELYDSIVKAYDFAADAGYDLNEASTMRRLGINNPDTFRQFLDSSTLQVLVRVCDGLKDIAGNTERLGYQYGFIAKMLDVTKIESRVEAAFLREHNILTSTDVLAARAQLAPRATGAALTI